MPVRSIAQLGAPILRQRARALSREELEAASIQALIDDMIETMRGKNGAGIAAPQVFESLSICVVELENNPRYPSPVSIPLSVFVNPAIEPLVPNPEQPSDHDAVVLYEGCLSVPGLRGRVRRPRRVRLTAWDRFGNSVDQEWEGIRAAVIQHEIDHLWGTLFVDRADPRTLCFTSEYERYVPEADRMVDGYLEV